MNQSGKHKHQKPGADYSDLSMQRPEDPFVAKLPEGKIPSASPELTQRCGQHRLVHDWHRIHPGPVATTERRVESSQSAPATPSPPGQPMPAREASRWERAARSSTTRSRRARSCRSPTPTRSREAQTLSRPSPETNPHPCLAMSKDIRQIAPP